MPPKEPIRIGLTKNKTKDDAARGGENVDLPESPDLDKTMPPLSASVMNVLEDMVDENESEDLFADEIERDIDPDYIQPENEPRPSTSKSVHKQPLKLVTVSSPMVKVEALPQFGDFLMSVTKKLMVGLRKALFARWMWVVFPVVKESCRTGLQLQALISIWKGDTQLPLKNVKPTR